VIVCSCNVLSDGQVRSAIGSAASIWINDTAEEGYLEQWYGVETSTPRLFFDDLIDVGNRLGLVLAPPATWEADGTIFDCAPQLSPPRLAQSKRALC
jgi:hypothetical protein